MNSIPKSRQVARFAVALFIAVIISVANAVCQDPPNMAVVSPSATYHSTDVDSVDMANGTLHIHIPLLVDDSQRGKLNFTYSVEFSGPVAWTLQQFCCYWYGWQPAGNIISTAFFGINQNIGPTTGAISAYDQLFGTYWNTAGYVTDGLNANHFLGHPTSGQWPMRTVDGSGILYSQDTSKDMTFINKDGIRFYYAANPSGLPISETIEDPNGNELTMTPVGTPAFIDSNYFQQSSTITDTLGRSWNFTWNAAGTTGCPTGTTSKNLWDVPGPNGTTREFKFCFTSTSIQTQFGGSVTAYSTTTPEMTAIVLPDGTMYQMTYDTYGSITKLSLPTGGSITYTWTYSDGVGVLNTREIFDGNNNSTWTYTWGGVGVLTNTLQDPLGNQTTYLPDSTVSCNSVSYRISTTKYYSGTASSGTLLKTETNTFEDLDDPLPSDVSGCPDPGLPYQTITAWPTGQTATKQQAYQVGQYHSGSTYDFTWDDPNFNDGCQCVLSPLTDGLYGLTRSTSQSDYYTGNPSSLPWLSTTNTSYLALTSSSYASANLLTLRSSVVINNGNNYQCSETDYAYDVAAQILTSGVTEQHVAAPMPGILGDLTSVTQQLYGNSCWSVSPTKTPLTTQKYIYDTGMPQRSIDPLTNTTATYSYSNAYYGAYPTSVCNAANQCTIYTYDFNTGLMMSMEDPNNQTTKFKYDIMLRPTQTSYADTGETTTAYNYSGNVFVGDTVTEIATPDPNIVTTQVFDGLGRLKETQLNSDPSGTTYTDITYDGDGRKSQVWNPTRCSPPQTNNCESTWGYTTYNYDPLDRVTSVVEQDGSGIVWSYSGNCAQRRDEALTRRGWCWDGLGRTGAVWEDPYGYNYPTTYTYDALGNLLSVTQNSSRQRTFAYDSLSRLLCVQNPEIGLVPCPNPDNGTYTAGTIRYAYDADGNLTTRTAPLENQTTPAVTVTTTYSHDSLNRLTQKSYSDGTPSPFFWYDQTNVWGAPITNGVGRVALAGVNDIAGTITSYDPMGRVAHQWDCTPLDCGSLNNRTYTYDLAGGISSYTDAASANLPSVTFTQTFSGARRITQLISSLTGSGYAANLATGIIYWPAGHEKQVTYGNGLTEARTFNNRLQPCRLNLNSSGAALSNCASSVPSGNVQDFNYGLNPGTDNGNVVSWVGTGNQGFNRTYVYDSLNRINTLSDSVTSNPCSGLSWGFDAWGNMTAQTVTAGSCGSWSASYNASNHITGTGFLYDAAGNLTNDGTHTYTYDAENRITKIDGGTTATYQYDANGRRVDRVTSAGATDYIYDQKGNIIADITGTNNTWSREYIYVNDQEVIQYANGTVYFVDHDHLGSTRMLTNLSGCITDSLDYLPFGALNSVGSASCPILDTTHKFTDKERDSESGLDNFGARYDSSQYGRFMSTDPDSASGLDHPDDPQSLNSYSYARNNPLLFTDPDGRDYTVCQVDRDGKVYNCGVVTDDKAFEDYARSQGWTIQSGMLVDQNGQTVGSASWSPGGDAAAANQITQYAGPLEFLGLLEASFIMPGMQALEGTLPETILGGGLGLGAAARGAGQGARPSAPPDLAALSPKIQGQMQTRGWTSQDIQNVYQNGTPTPTVDRTAGNAPATQYQDPGTGKFIVVNNATGKVIQVSGPGYLPNPPVK